MIRMYRKFGLAHEEIKDILNYNVEEIVQSFEKRLKEMEDEIEKLNSLRGMFRANIAMIKNIERYAQGFIEQNIEASYYIEYQNKDTLFSEKERIKAIQNFMYLPETKEVFIFKKTDIEKNKLNFSYGFAAKKKDTDKFNIEINEYMTFLPVQKCVYFLLKTYLDLKNDSELNNSLLREKFKKAFEYLKENNMVLDNDILGFNITSAVENGENVKYTLICMPVRSI